MRQTKEWLDPAAEREKSDITRRGSKQGSRLLVLPSGLREWQRMAWASGVRIVEHRGASWSIAADSGGVVKQEDVRGD